MTVSRCLLCLCFVLSTTVSAEAGTKTQAGPSTQHVLGTVTAIDEQHVKVKTSRGVVVSVKTTQVLFKDKSNPQSTSPPTVGDRVIIEATKENKVLTATVVYYSPVKNASATAP